jgi:manganese transport protein
MVTSENRSSLPEVRRRIKIPQSSGFWRKLFAYARPGYLVSVGDTNLGKWDTDIAGIAKFDCTITTSVRYSPETLSKTGGFQA